MDDGNECISGDNEDLDSDDMSDNVHEDENVNPDMYGIRDDSNNGNQQVFSV